MGRRVVSMLNYTPTATADATNLANGTYSHVIQGSAAGNIVRMWEINIIGMASSSSSPTPMMLARDSTVGATVGSTTNVDTVIDSSSTAAAVSTSNAWTTAPQRSATLRIMMPQLNAFGGTFFWRANRIEECAAIVGLSANTGEMSLSATTGGTVGAISTHSIYETA